MKKFLLGLAVLTMIVPLSLVLVACGSNGQVIEPMPQDYRDALDEVQNTISGLQDTIDGLTQALNDLQGTMSSPKITVADGEYGLTGFEIDGHYYSLDLIQQNYKLFFSSLDHNGYDDYKSMIPSFENFFYDLSWQYNFQDEFSFNVIGNKITIGFDTLIDSQILGTNPEVVDLDSCITKYVTFTFDLNDEGGIVLNQVRDVNFAIDYEAYEQIILASLKPGVSIEDIINQNEFDTVEEYIDSLMTTHYFGIDANYPNYDNYLNMIDYVTNMAKDYLSGVSYEDGELLVPYTISDNHNQINIFGVYERIDHQVF